MSNNEIKYTTLEHIEEMVSKLVEDKLTRWNSAENGYTKMTRYSQDTQKVIAKSQAVDFLKECGWRIGTEEQIRASKEAYFLKKLEEDGRLEQAEDFENAFRDEQEQTVIGTISPEQV